MVLVSHSSNFHHWPLLAFLVALELHSGDSVDLNFAIPYMIIGLYELIGGVENSYLLLHRMFVIIL